MRWEDERYVRVYTRNTISWRMLPWEARTTLLHLFRAVDRAGLLEVEEYGIDGVAALLELPVEIVKTGLAKLTEKKIIQWTGERSDVLFIPNFLAAQEAHSSDAQRKRDQRERAAAGARLKTLGVTEETNSDDLSRIVTSGHEAGREVTIGHEQSQSVTACHSVPSVPSCAVPSVLSDPDEGELADEELIEHSADSTTPILDRKWFSRLYCDKTGVLTPDPSTLEQCAKLIEEYARAGGYTDVNRIAQAAIEGFFEEIGSWRNARTATPGLFIRKWDEIQGRMTKKTHVADWLEQLTKASERERKNYRARFVAVEAG